MHCVSKVCERLITLYTFTFLFLQILERLILLDNGTYCVSHRSLAKQEYIIMPRTGPIQIAHTFEHNYYVCKLGPTLTWLDEALAQTCKKFYIEM